MRSCTEPGCLCTLAHGICVYCGQVLCAQLVLPLEGAAMSRLNEVRHGRNFIRSGDLVRATPSRTGKHDGYVARFLYADTDRGGLFYAVQELDGGGRVVAHRFLFPHRVKRLARTKQPFR